MDVVTRYLESAWNGAGHIVSSPEMLGVRIHCRENKAEINKNFDEDLWYLLLRLCFILNDILCEYSLCRPV